MLSIVQTVDESLLPKALVQLLPLTPDGTPKDWLIDGVKKGIFQVCELHHEGHPFCIAWYVIQEDGGLYVTATGALTNKNMHGELAGCLDILARQHKCAYITFATRREGLIKESQRFGYFVESVNIRKILS